MGCGWITRTSPGLSGMTFLAAGCMERSFHPIMTFHHVHNLMIETLMCCSLCQAMQLCLDLEHPSRDVRTCRWLQLWMLLDTSTRFCPMPWTPRKSSTVRPTGLPSTCTEDASWSIQLQCDNTKLALSGQRNDQQTLMT